MAANSTSQDKSQVVLHPTQYLQRKNNCSNEETSTSRTALIILNSPLSDPEYVRRLYDHATFRICADGGANRLHDLVTKSQPHSSWQEALRSMLPDLIHGDLDSLRDDVQDKYERIGVNISHDPDQYSTDFGKAIKKVVQSAPDVRDVLVLGSLGGRVDQGIGLLHEFYREQMHRRPNVRFWLFSESSVSVLLMAGTTTIMTPINDGLIKRNVGVLPLYGPARITTQGLEWDVEDWQTEMGGQVSTSNHVMGGQISITTDKEVLFTIERTVNNDET
jgi:thiamine pyrophosphokinase